MNDETFAHQLTSWLDPLALLECVGRYDVDRDRALAPATLIVGSGRLHSGDEGNYAELIRKFLSGFRIPLPVLELLRSLQKPPGSSDDSWRWLADLTISARVRVCSRGKTPAGVPPHTILLLDERDAVVDLLRAPVLALLDLVDQVAFTWRELAALSASIYHEPNMPSPFYAYVDSRVAASFLTLVTQPNLTRMRGPKFRYRAVTVYGRPEPSDPIWQITQEAARGMAASTLQPIPPHEGLP